VKLLSTSDARAGQRECGGADQKADAKAERSTAGNPCSRPPRVRTGALRLVTTPGGSRLGPEDSARRAPAVTSSAVPLLAAMSSSMGGMRWGAAAGAWPPAPASGPAPRA